MQGRSSVCSLPRFSGDEGSGGSVHRVCGSRYFFSAFTGSLTASKVANSTL